ncbi:hypothetical protein [Clostridium intestinale]|jgi:predicted transcriptional regulator|uniref:XRE family transcriptional regulator n=1 Tax=Clostridium intestinale TaxID=36845 RepID=A0A7D6VNN4_9CLOT|nr:hypothetical protein [Clostridium intestinale]QLY78068.1 hypothetical protein HZF06_13300 [Clostridium intestinale]WRY53151.1 hypothetical protein P8F83_08070 [Clostridium intestinale]
MKFNINKLSTVINEDFSGNYKAFATEINVNSTTVYRILTGRSNAGEKFIANFMLFCNSKKYKFEDFIFLR